LFVVFSTLLVSGLCSLFEATLYSTRVAALEAARDQGRNVAGASQFLRLKREIAIPTSAILILNTVANTAGATFAGMLAADALGSAWLPVFSAGLTLAILFLSEILPKTYGAIHWKTLWGAVVWPLVAMEKLLRPFIFVTQWFAGLFVRTQTGPTTTEDEIIAMIRMGASSGQLSPTELRLLTRVFQFDEMEVGEIMLPRGDINIMDVSWPLSRCVAEIRRTWHTRYPLCRGSLDDVLGFIHIKDLMGAAPGAELDLASLARPLLKVPETMPIRSVLRQMQTDMPHMAAVVDEHGTLVGVIALEDVLEQLVGAVQDEFDRESPEIVPERPGVYLVKGRFPVSRLNADLGLMLSTDAATLSGLLVARMGRLLRRGDIVELDGATAQVLAVRGDRASRVRLILRADRTDTDAADDTVAADAAADVAIDDADDAAAETAGAPADESGPRDDP
jgi:CBS domain containing-hemolysin-like protein